MDISTGAWLIMSQPNALLILGDHLFLNYIFFGGRGAWLIPRVLLILTWHYLLVIIRYLYPWIVSHYIPLYHEFPHIGPGRVWHQPCWIVIPFFGHIFHSLHHQIISKQHIYIYVSLITLVSINNYIRIIYPHWYPHYITIFPNSSWFNSQILSGYISSF